ncbi:MAG: FHA domain-containing protein [Clostridiaceae bacterium]|nr:FHA domain-containing protein [Clostridiaceae bacterium]
MKIKVFGDAISGLQRIIFVNKKECVEKLEISLDTFENWEKGRSKPSAGNSEYAKNVSIIDVMEVFEAQYNKRLVRGMMDRELLEDFLSCMPLPEATKEYLSEYIMKPGFAQKTIECAYEYHNLLQNKAEFLWKKVIEIYSDNDFGENKRKLKVILGNRTVIVSTDLGITLKKLAEGIVSELSKRDLIENEFEYKKHYSFRIRDKEKKIHVIKANEQTHLSDIEEINYNRIEMVERIGETTVVITANMEVEEVVYPFMERILEDNSSNPEKFRVFKDYFVIGRRSEDSDYVISSRFIGNTHALINLESGRYYITDLNSRNGTYVNGERLKPSEKREIFNNDIIGIVNFKYLFAIPEN